MAVSVARRPRRLELVHDLVCARSYLGFARLRRAVARYRTAGGDVVLVCRPYQIRPSAPPEGEPLYAVHVRERGADFARRVRADTTFGAAEGLRFRFDRAVFTNTFEAHRLLAHAAAQKRAAPLADRLFRAYFTEGRNIADPVVLAELAHATGVTDDGSGAAALRAELARTRPLGSDTGPRYYLDGDPVLHEEATEEDLLHLLRTHP